MNKLFRKQREIDVADSNLALVGSDLDKKVRKAAANDAPEWKTAGKQIERATGFGIAGLQIWRIEKFHVVSWPKDQYGHFYSGDSYIILYTYMDEDSKKKLFNVHFWIGSESTQDEYGTAAYKTVELDALLDDLPVQYREVQGDESPLFRGYFSKIIIMKGGIESGFNHVDPEAYEPRLLHIRQPENATSGTARRGSSVYTKEVPLTAKSLNSGDCFIYDAGLNLFQFNGKGASGLERIRAAQLARAIDNERKGQAEVHVFEEGDQSTAENSFWDGVGGKRAIPAEMDKGKSPRARSMQLLRLSDKSGTMQFKEEKKSSFTKLVPGSKEILKLDTNDTFVFDSGTVVYVWVGARASDAERRGGMGYATHYLKTNSLDAKTPIVRVPEGTPVPAFEKSLGAFFLA